MTVTCPQQAVERASSRPQIALIGASFIAMAGFASGCATARPLVPLDKGEVAWELSTPGTWLGSGNVRFPATDIVVGARYGTSETTEAALRLHGAPLPFGVIGLEAAGIYHGHAASGWRPGWHVQANGGLLVKASRLLERPANAVRGGVGATVLIHSEPVRWLRPYLVIENNVVIVDMSWVPSAMIGVQVDAGPRVQLSFEIGAAALNKSFLHWTQPYEQSWPGGVLWTGFGITMRGERATRARPRSAPATVSPSPRVTK